MMKKATSILLSLFLCFTAHGQNASPSSSQAEQKSERVEIIFDFNSSAVDPDHLDNKERLTHLTNLIDRLRQDSLIKISKYEINSYASPEGGHHYNLKMTKKRTEAIYNYLTQTISVPDSLIEKRHSGIDWDGLYTQVESSDMQYRDEVLHIIKNTPEETWRRVNPTDVWMTLVDSRIKHLMDLKYGNPYRYIAANYFAQMRMGSIVTIYFKSIAPSIIEEPKEVVEPEQADTLASTEVTPVAEPVMQDSGTDDKDGKSIKFALKTNLLYTLMTIPNIELEVPIKDKWSVAGEYMCPWWITRSNGFALQMIAGQVEGRYWFGDRTTKPQLTGWFAGVYAGGGLYDLQWKDNGYQGEFYIAAGLAGGYAHTINKKGNLRMEYSLGLGYLNTNYRYYEGKRDNEYLVWQYDGRYTWLGPTKAEVSLVWFIDWKMGGKR